MHADRGANALLKKHKAAFIGKLASPSIKLGAWRGSVVTRSPVHA